MEGPAPDVIDFTHNNRPVRLVSRSGTSAAVPEGIQAEPENAGWWISVDGGPEERILDADGLETEEEVVAFARQWLDGRGHP